MLLLTIGLIGCSKGTNDSHVSGTVTMDGEPVKMGAIEFSPVDGTDTGQGDANIVDGQYSAKVMPGEKVVRIEVRKVVGQRIADPGVDDRMIDEIVTVVDRSDLRATVKSGRNTNVNFDLIGNEKE